MILLGVDYGTKRIGLATGDSESAMAFPLRSIESNTQSIGEVVAIAATEGAEKIVVGIPYRLDGEHKTPGDTEQKVTDFLAALKNATNISVDTEDERMTSALVDRWREEAGTKKKDFDRDAAAATAILESYIERARKNKE